MQCSGACRTAAVAGTVCSVSGTASCASGVVTGQICNGTIAGCATSTNMCDPYVCNAAGTGCATSCTSDADCVPTALCGTSGTCIPRKANGKSCATSAECVSRNCIDGYCCNTACSGQCEACDVTGQEGTCTPVEMAPHGKRAACAGTGTPCAGQCDGSSTLACAYPGATTSCGSTCTAGKQTSEVCDGKGACAPSATSTPCNPYVCDATTNECKSKCATDADCATGNACTAGVCAPSGGAHCSADGSTSTPASPPGAMPIACSPFICNSMDGACFQTCTMTSQCAAGYSCDSSTSRCVPVAAGSSGSSSGGCGCELPGRSQTGSLWPALALVGLGLARMRRRAMRS